MKGLLGPYVLWGGQSDHTFNKYLTADLLGAYGSGSGGRGGGGGGGGGQGISNISM